MSKLVLNIVAYQIGWFSCVLGAANGYPLLGPVVVLGAMLLHLRLTGNPRGELLLALAAVVAGVVFDSGLVRTGWVAYPNGMPWGGVAPYWIIAIWPLFASTMNVSLRWLHGRPLLAVLLGAAGGPLSYLAGSRLGALEFVNQPAALAYLAIGWALVTPLLVGLAQWLERAPKPDADALVSQHA